MSNIAYSPLQAPGKIYPFVTLNPQNIIANFAPGVHNNAQIGTFWIEPTDINHAAVNGVWVLTSKIGGINNWANLTGGSSSFLNINLPYTTATVGRFTYDNVLTFNVPESTSFFAGQAAGNVAKTGTNDTGVGTLVLSSLTTGNRNSALGSESQAGVSSGSDNASVGYNSLNALTSGSDNVALGSGALSDLVTGSSNIAIGFGAGQNYTTNESGNILINDPGTLGESDVFRAVSNSDMILATTGSTSFMNLVTNGLVQVNAVLTNSASPTIAVTANQRVVRTRWTGFTTAAAGTLELNLLSNQVTTASAVLVTAANLDASANHASMAVNGVILFNGSIQVNLVNNGAGALGAGDDIIITFWIID